MKHGSDLKKYLLCFVFSGVVTTCLEIYATAVQAFNNANFNSLHGFSKFIYFIDLLCLRRLLIAFLLVLLVTIFLEKQKQTPAEFLFRYRFLISSLLLLIMIIFELNGSSIAAWKSYFASSAESVPGNLLGIARGIRADEWAVNTPMAISQEYNHYAYFTNIIRGCLTDTFIVYGQPVFDIAEIFRPFHWGYLLLGSTRGLSFFWYGRLIALFLVTLQMMMVITNRSKRLSLIGAMMITLAPSIQWWFAVNGLVEMLVFGQLAVLMLYCYLKTEKYIIRYFCLLVMVICAGGYILTFYPAWQVPLAYVFGGLAIWVFADHYKSARFSITRDILPAIGAAAILAVSMFYVFTKSSDTVKAVLGTVYPGSRVSTGGDMSWQRYFIYPFNLVFPFFEVGIPVNVCEQAVFFDLFPIPMIASLIVLKTNKKKDLLLIILLSLSLLLGTWCLLGFPIILSKITLLSFTTTGRCFLAIGLIHVFLLIRALSICHEPLSKKWAAVTAILAAVVIIIICQNYFPGYIDLTWVISIGVILVLCFYFFWQYQTTNGTRVFTVLLALVMVLCGGLVNPVRTGINNLIDDIPILGTMQVINNNESGLWIVEGSGYTYSNLALLIGIPSIDSTNVYPNLERWQLLDPDGQYMDIYNRYAHINMNLVKASDASFELLSPDYIRVNISVENLADLDVDYILSANELEAYSTDKISIRKIFSDGRQTPDFMIYKVQMLD